MKPHRRRSDRTLREHLAHALFTYTLIALILTIVIYQTGAAVNR